MKYTKIYQDHQDVMNTTTKGRKVLKMLFGKKNISFQKYAEIIKDLSVKNYNDKDGVAVVKLINEELQWRNDGSPSIFLETQELLNYLYSAKFNFEKDFNVAPPFKTFSMVFPENTDINGVRLKSSLITIMSRKEFIDLYGPSVITLLDICGTEYDEDELCISVNYLAENYKHNNNFTHLSSIYSTLKSNKINPLANKGTNMLEALTKIALALCVYHSATDGKKLVQGYPSSSISLPKNKTRGNYKAITIRSYKENANGVVNNERKITHRIPYYRNLRNERFYKKEEYKHMKPGSRWVFVKEVDINGSVNTLLN